MEKYVLRLLVSWIRIINEMSVTDNFLLATVSDVEFNEKDIYYKIFYFYL